MRVDINEEFTDPLGRWSGYDAYDFPARSALADQKHTDLRVFQHQNVSTGGSIITLNSDTMAMLDGDTMTDVSNTIIVDAGELWNISTVGPDAARQNFRTLRAALTAGTPTTIYSHTDAAPVDLSSYAPDDFISVALPSFPASSLNLGQTYLRLGDGTNFAQVAFSTSLTPLTNGNSELRVRIDQFTGIDLSKIVDVGFIFLATASTTVVAMSYRAVSKNWHFGSLDYDTRYNRLRRTVPRNGDLTASPEYTQPIMWRGSSPPAIDDPKPIDGEVGVLFNTGSKTNANQFAVYFRELTEDFLTMGDLDGFAMSTFDGNDQPDVGEARFNQTKQSDLELYSQTDLEGRSQYDLERVPDYLSALWTQFLLQWSATATTITLGNSEGTAYTFTAPTLVANTDYAFFAHIEENEVWARIYAVDLQGNVGALIFDTTTIVDDNTFKRRKGRFGWWANFSDADATIDAIQDRGFTYAEYRSVPMKSLTPVVGAELFVGTSPNVEHYQYFTPGIFNRSDYSSVERDTAKNTTGESWRVTDFGTQVFQGVESNVFKVSDFANTEVNFDLFYPSAALLAGGSLAVVLLDEKKQRSIPLLMPQIIPDQWQSINMKLPQNFPVLTGYYHLLIYSTAVMPVTWWVDNTSIFTRTVVWEGRAVVDDAWNANDARWTPFRNVLNHDSGGILFTRRGTDLQVRAKGLAQTSVINRVQFRPKYAPLGRFKPGVTVTNTLPTASFTSAAQGPPHGMRFTSTSSDTGRIILTEWNFGDGSSGIGEVVDHVYAAAGPYTVNVIVTDDVGGKSTSSTVVNVA